MQCPACSQDNPAHARFCLGCGARLAVACSACGIELPSGARFCLACGQPVGTKDAKGLATLAPESYTPKHLAEQILTSRGALEGERKQVTILFADLKGSMELLADRDPEEARKLLDPVLERMMEAVHRYEGTVNQVMGDGIMALFGAPLAHEDHAVRACYAALRMQEAVSRYGDELQRLRGVPVQIRVGLNSGEVVVRSIGSDLRMDYSAIGQTTHLAARMEQMARPGTTLLTADTLRLAEGYVQVQPLGPATVKGLDAPVEVFELKGVGPVRSRLQAAAARGLTRFVGRSAEIEQLQRALDQARAGHGQVVAVVGEPGVGKSRLFWEFTRSHRTAGCLVLESASVSYGKATAYLPVLELLKRYARIEDRDDARAIREKVTGKFLALDSALEDAIPPVLSLLEALPAEHPFLSLDPTRRRQLTLDGFKRLFLRESRVEPLVLVFEDLHWIDAETQALLDGLLDSVPTARLLLLVNYRPEFRHGWGSKTYYSQLRIDSLPGESADELLQSLLGTDAGLDPLRRLLIGRTEGNPFFLEESVRSLVETGMLAGDRGAYQLTQASTAIHVPATVQSILAARIDRLSPEEKRLLQSASVIGKDVPVALLGAIADMPEDALLRALSHLQAAEFLYEAQLFPDAEYTFKHALTHEVAYGSLLQERRRALHGRIAHSIERLYPGRLAEQVERLAYHAQRGEQWDRAYRFWRQAGAKAQSRSAYREAIDSFEQALEALAHLPESRDTTERAIDTRFDIRNPLHVVGELDKILARLHEAEVLATALDDQRRLGRTLSYLSQYSWLTGDNLKAVDAGQRALGIASAAGDPALEAATNLYLGLAYNAQGSFRRAAGALARTIQILDAAKNVERAGQVGSFIHANSWLALSLAETGDFAEALKSASEAARAAEAADRSFDIVTASFGVGHTHLRQGDFSRAIAVLERALALVEAGGFRTWLGTITSSLGYAYTLAGRRADGLALLERAATLKVGHFRLRWVYLGEARLLAGRVDEAEELGTRVLQRSRATGARGDEAWSLRLLGDIVSAGADAAGAERHYLQAMDVATEAGMRPTLAHCHLGLGRLFAKTKNSGGAQAQLEQARTLYRKMGMRVWETEADAALRLAP
jgi:class 3 adenylate cyclase/tetratricopeptide (TPR) repeat protein